MTIVEPELPDAEQEEQASAEEVPSSSSMMELVMSSPIYQLLALSYALLLLCMCLMCCMYCVRVQARRAEAHYGASDTGKCDGAHVGDQVRQHARDYV